MTLDDMRDLSEILRDSPLTPDSLARHLLATVRENQILRMERESLKSDLRKAKYGRKTEAELRVALEAKTKALDFAVRRNEVLRKQITSG
jgi:regulator of replication initiation timing